MHIDLLHIGTCHSRWCPSVLPAFMDNITHLPVTALCTNVSRNQLERHFNSSSVYRVVIAYGYNWLVPACKLWCGEPGHQLLQLQTFGFSRTVAILMWFMVMLMMTCAVLQLVSICIEWGGRKVVMVGGPFFLAYIALIVSFISQLEYDTAVYPLVEARSVAVLSYFFSSFQYSIGVTYELASATALVFTMFPIWNLFTVNRSRLFAFEHEVDLKLVDELIWLVFTMLIVSLLWIIHSCIYRTVVFKANWIAAFNRQVRDESVRGKNVMRGLWILSGAQGHPTWRTPTGHSFGLYLTVLSWVVTMKIQIYFAQGNHCKEDLILFHILWWAPPIILTLAMLATQLCMCGKASCDVQGNSITLLENWLMVDCKFLLESKAHMEEALISYRLGRDTLEAEDSNEVNEYKIAFCGRHFVDKLLAIILWTAEVVFMFIAYPGILVCKILQWIGIYFLNITWLKWCQGSSDLTLSDKIKAYQIVCEHCTKAIKPTSEEESVYERSRRESHGLQGSEIDEAVRTMLRKRRKHIKLSLVLDNIGPSCFLYLLAMLEEVLNSETTLSDTNDSNGEKASNSNPTLYDTNDSNGEKALT